MTAKQRFWAKVRKSRNPNGCWLWMGTLTSRGYGNFKFGGRNVLAHRFAYELWIGPVPDGLELDHTCRIHNCVRPTHLEPVTHAENLLRGDTVNATNHRKTHCPAGHPYSGDNLYIAAGGGRVCRECHRQAVRHYRARRKEAIA